MTGIESVFREAFDEARDGFALVRDGYFQYVNPAFAVLLGRSASTLQGESLEAYIINEDVAALRAWLTDEDRSSIELRFEHEDGKPRILSLSTIRSVRAGESHLDGLTARDITRRRRVEAELLVADRMMSIGALAAGVAHDINNPLSYVLGNLDFIGVELEQLEVDSDIKEAVAESREGAERVRMIVSDLRAFARADAGTTRSLDVSRVVASAINMAFVEIRHRARLEKEIQPTPPVRANEARLGQMVLNLLLNAVQAMKEGAKEDNVITVRTWTSDDQAVVEVRDNGPGIPAELLGRVFDPFFTTKPKGIGTGLGLAIVRTVVDEVGGHVEVDTALGEGTGFIVRLPSARTLAAEDLPDELSVGSVRVARVLVVDDDPLITSTLKRSLLRDGHAVVVETSGQDALRRLAADNDFDAIFCDLLMPGSSGVEVFDWVEKEAPELGPRFVFMSGGVFTEAAHTFLSRVDNPCIDKPFETEAISRLLTRMLVEREKKESSAG